MFDLSHIKNILNAFSPTALPNTPLAAAVLVILLADANRIEIVITKRATTLPTYAGHYSFPGGMFEEADEDLLQTAIRETAEELHLSANDYEMIGQLNDFMETLCALLSSPCQNNIFKKRTKLRPRKLIDCIYCRLQNYAICAMIHTCMLSLNVAPVLVTKQATFLFGDSPQLF
jgi:hypothetical protein